MAKAPAFVLESGRLHPSPDVTTRTRSLELIDMFIRKYGGSDVIEWAAENTRPQSELVVHPQDGTLRIDLQPSPPGWANFQLQAGAKSLACVLVECNRSFRASDVKEAWLESFKATKNARMKWRFLPSRMQEHVLNALDAWEARDLNAILDVLRHHGSTRVVDTHLLHLAGEIPAALAVLEKQGLVRRQGAGWILTQAGIEYT
ncbi:MAG: hypothetical protein WD894_21785 [Pirellulales bacterium]